MTDERRIGHGREINKEDAVGRIVKHTNRALLCEPGLTDSSDAREHDEAVLPHQVNHRLDRRDPTHERSDLYRQVVPPGVNGAQRFERAGPELEDAFGSGQVPQLVFAQADERHVADTFAEEPRRQFGAQHLAAVGEIAKPTSSIHRRPEVVAGPLVSLSRVQADSDPKLRAR